MPGRQSADSRLTPLRRIFALTLARTTGTRLRAIAVPGLVAAAPDEPPDHQPGIGMPDC